MPAGYVSIAQTAGPREVTAAPAGGWPTFDVSLTAALLAGAPPSDGASALAAGTPVEGAPVLAWAVGRFTARDWLPALADALHAHLSQTSPLRSQLGVALSGRPAEAGAAVQGRVATFLARRPGELGRKAASEVAHAALQELLAARGAEGDLAERQALAPLLANTARAVATPGAPLLAALEAASTAVLADVSRRIDPTQLGVGRLTAQVVDLAQQVADRVPRGEFEAALRRKADSDVVGGRLDELFGSVRSIEDRLERPP